jgi:CDP-diacylglycerol--glycerol-3-phosphate 3-phosphatidyltransferase
MANLITSTRLSLLFVLVLMAYHAPPMWQLVEAPLVLLIFLLDGLDGYVARLRQETSIFGSIFDVAADRIVEIVLWIVLADIGLVPVWVAVVFVVRGNIVDAIRFGALSQGVVPLGMFRSSWGRLIVAGRGMRAAYGGLKAVTFAWLFALQPWPNLFVDSWGTWAAPATAFAAALVYASVAFCILRGAPVVIEFLGDARVFARERTHEAD